MSELKPVAWMWYYRGFAFVTANETKAMELQEDPEIKVTPLYALPEKVKAQWQEESFETAASICEEMTNTYCYDMVNDALHEAAYKIRQHPQDAANAKASQ